MNRSDAPPLLQPPQTDYPGVGPDDRMEQANITRNRRRLAIFLAVFLFSALIGLIYTFWRPPVYAATGVLNILPGAISDVAEDLTQEINVQVQLLKSQELLTRLETAVGIVPRVVDNPDNVDIGQGNLIAIAASEGSTVLELRAVGAPPEYLSVLVNTWIDVYLELHAQRHATTAAANTADLTTKRLELDALVTQKRAELDRFRRENNIVSLERDENRILAQQKGMAKSLNTANEELAAARAELDAINQSLELGKPVAKKEDSRTIANLEDRAEDLRGQLRAYAERYTPGYMRADPEIVALRRSLTEVEAELSNRADESRRLRIAEAEQAYAAATRKLAGLRRTMDEYEQQTMEFTSKFSEYAALEEELVQLEILQRETNERLVKVQVRLDRIPKVQVLDRASVPDSPIFPHYWRDAGISVASALLLGLFAVLMHDFFFRRAPSGTRPQPWPVFYPVGADGLFAEPSGKDKTLPPARGGTAGLLQQQQHLPSAMAKTHIKRLLEIADDGGRLLVYVLLSGLTLKEAAALAWSDVEPETGVLKVSGKSTRTIPLSAPLARAFAAFATAAGTMEGPVWQQQDGQPLGSDNLVATLGILGHDAGLADSDLDVASQLRHTYIVYLVQQGARLSELKRIVGEMPPAELSAYRGFSPTGTARPLEQIRIVHPLLEDAALDLAD